MKVKYTGESDPISLLNGKIYDVLSVEEDWYRIIDEEGDDGHEPKGYLYPPNEFELVEA